MGRLFGTDGIRGVVNEDLDGPLAYGVGQAVATVLQAEGPRPLVVLGSDTRISGDLLKAALTAGLCSAGADVVDLGVMPTPAVAWTTIDRGADAGIMITASHNPFAYNGIKVFNSQGYKLSDALEDRVEELVLLAPEQLRRCRGGEVGRVTRLEDPCGPYLQGLLLDQVVAANKPLSPLRIVVDCGHGACVSTTGLFSQLKQLGEVTLLHHSPDGVNINDHCGSTDLGPLQAQIEAGGYDLGIAFDGDGDRCLLVDETGGLVDGDQMLALYALHLKEQGKLPHNTLVGTVMSNLGLHVFAKAQGLNLLCTDVGDRHVLEAMVSGGYAVGAEQSGHMIFRAFLTTGDGLLTALMMLCLLSESGQKASQFFGVCPRYPQVLINVPISSKEKKQAIMESPDLAKEISAQEEKMGDSGRILVRPSGTEALLRVMVEATTEEEAQEVAQQLVSLVKTL